MTLQFIISKPGYISRLPFENMKPRVTRERARVRVWLAKHKTSNEEDVVLSSKIQSEFASRSYETLPWFQSRTALFCRAVKETCGLTCSRTRTLQQLLNIHLRRDDMILTQDYFGMLYML